MTKPISQEMRLSEAVGSEPSAAAAGVHVVADGVVALGGDDQVVAFALHQPAEDLLGAAAGILVRAIEEVDAEITASLVHSRGFRLVGVAAERHRAETQL